MDSYIEASVSFYLDAKGETIVHNQNKAVEMATTLGTAVLSKSRQTKNA